MEGLWFSQALTPTPRGLRSGLAKPGPCLSCDYKDQAGGDAEDSLSEHLPRPREEGDPTPDPLTALLAS